MAKSKNHSSHHQSRKHHRNGIKKPKVGTVPLRHMSPQYREEYKRALRLENKERRAAKAAKLAAAVKPVKK